jgi:c-di-AMP phosphodiesterase-like protein
MKRRRFSIPMQIILGLIVIGLFASIVNNLSSYLIPLLVFAAIFILYKYPPNRLIRKGSSKTTISYRNKSREKKKPSPFRVIQGNKDLSDEDTPKFH